jgi:hypothetical protein
VGVGGGEDLQAGGGSQSWCEQCDDVARMPLCHQEAVIDNGSSDGHS